MCGRLSKRGHGCEYHTYTEHSFKRHIKDCGGVRSKEDCNAEARSCRRIVRELPKYSWCGYCARWLDFGGAAEERWELRFSHIEDHFLARNGNTKTTRDQWRVEPVVAEQNYRARDTPVDSSGVDRVAPAPSAGIVTRKPEYEAACSESSASRQTREPTRNILTSNSAHGKQKKRLASTSPSKFDAQSRPAPKQRSGSERDWAHRVHSSNVYITCVSLLVVRFRVAC